MGLGNDLEKILLFKQKVEEKETSKQTEKNEHVRKRIRVVRSQGKRILRTNEGKSLLSINRGRSWKINAHYIWLCQEYSKNLT